jgi:WD40 repeat protein
VSFICSDFATKMFPQDLLVEEWCRAALRLLRVNSFMLQHYPHQIHTSALVFAPQNSPIYKTYHPRFVLPKILNSLPSNLSPSRILVQQALGIMDCGFSSDGQRILCVTGSRLVQIWDAKTGRLISYLEGLSSSVNCGAWSEDGHLIATGGETDHTIRLWDGITGNIVWKYPRWHEDAIINVAFVLGDRYIVSTSRDLTIRRWPIEYDRSKWFQGKLHEFKGAKHTAEIVGLRVSKDRKRLISYSYDNQVILWNPENVEVVQVIKLLSGIMKAAFSFDDQLIIIGCEDGSVQIWEIKTNSFTRTLLGHDEDVGGIAVSPDGRTLATGSPDRISFWDIFTGHQLYTEALERGVVEMTFSKRGDKLVWGGQDGTLRVLEVYRNSERFSTRNSALHGHTTMVSLIDVSPDGEFIVSASSDRTFRLWDIGDLSTLSSTDKVDHEPIDFMDLSADGTKLLSGIRRGSLQLWDTRTGEKFGDRIHYSDRELSSLKLSSDGTLFAAGYIDGSIHIWEISTTSTSLLELNSFEVGSQVTCIQFSLDNSVIASGSQRAITLWDLKSQRLQWKAPFETNPYCISLSADGRFFTAYMSDFTLQMWDCEAKRQLRTSITEAKGIIMDHVMSQSSNGMYTAIRGGRKVHLYSIRGEDELVVIGKFEVKEEHVVLFSHDGRYVFIGPQTIDLDVIQALASDTPLTEIPARSLQRDIPSLVSPLICEFIILGGKGTIYNSESSRVLLMLPREIVVCRWLAHGDRIILGLKDGEVVIIHIPEAFYRDPLNVPRVEVKDQPDLEFVDVSKSAIGDFKGRTIEPRG